jgi:glutaredoxin
MTDINFSDEILGYKLRPQATVYGRENCKESARLWHWAKFSGFDIEYLNLDEDYDIIEVAMLNVRRLPAIVVDGELIGDCDEFMSWLYFQGK